ncbi:MAG: ABC-2 family transporter protein, partial [Anaerolineae bacterium]|nr:ABC-2 family transporter protein [Anaerolineae bacterium]
MMPYYADLYLTYFRFTLKSWSQYRVSFAITFACSIVGTGAQLAFLTLIFANIRQLEGWSFDEMLLIWGLMVTATHLANTFLDVPHRILGYIRRGDMDRLLVRPPALLFQIAGEGGITLQALSRVLIGAAAILAALATLQDKLPWWTVFYLPLTVISGMLIMFSVQLLLACLTFWFVNTFSLMQTIAWMNQFGQYPATILALPLRFLLTWVLPYAMMGFYPAAFLLRGDEYRLYGLLAPLM